MKIVKSSIGNIHPGNKATELQHIEFMDKVGIYVSYFSDFHTKLLFTSIASYNHAVFFITK